MVDTVFNPDRHPTPSILDWNEKLPLMNTRKHIAARFNRHIKPYCEEPGSKSPVFNIAYPLHGFAQYHLKNRSSPTAIDHVTFPPGTALKVVGARRTGSGKLDFEVEFDTSNVNILSKSANEKRRKGWKKATVNSEEFYKVISAPVLLIMFITEVEEFDYAKWTSQEADRQAAKRHEENLARAAKVREQQRAIAAEKLRKEQERLEAIRIEEERQAKFAELPEWGSW